MNDKGYCKDLMYADWSGSKSARDTFNCHCVTDTIRYYDFLYNKSDSMQYKYKVHQVQFKYMPFTSIQKYDKQNVELENYEIINRDTFLFFLPDQYGQIIWGQIADNYKSMINYLNENLVYPDYEKQKNIQGKVEIKFTINELGYINNIRIIESPSDGLSLLSKEVFNHQTKWAPVLINGKVTKISLVLPIKYTLK